MATDTATVASPKRLWQVPIFFLGCLTATGMYFFHDHIAQASPNRPEHLLADARGSARRDTDGFHRRDRCRRARHRTDGPAVGHIG